MMEFQFLGTGDAAQVPCYGCYCSACSRARAMTIYRRTACSAKITTEQGTVLIGAGQANLTERFPLQVWDAILLTHYHVDHVQGLFQLRWGKGATLPVFGPDDSQGRDNLFPEPGLLDFQPPPALFESFDLAGVTITPLSLNYSQPSLGYLIDDGHWSLAYLTDTRLLPEQTAHFLQKLKPHTVVIDCTYPPIASPKNHNSLIDALAIIDILEPPKAYLTHISHELDAFLQRNHYPLPEHVFLANDNETLVYDDCLPLANQWQPTWL